MNKIVARMGAVSAALVAGLVMAPAALAAPAVAAPSEAFGLKAEGLIKIPALPYVSGKNGFDQKSVVEIPGEHSDLIKVKALTAAAGDNYAKATVAGLRLDLELDLLKGLNLGGAPLLKAGVITATCKSGKASSALVDAKLAGRPLDVEVAPNTGIEIPGLAKVMLNEQKKNKNGTTTVTAISIKVSELQSIDIASATCGAGDSNGGTTTKPAPTTTSANSTPGGTAPRPVPAPAHIAVTG